MRPPELLRYAWVTRSGAVLLGSNFAVDGHAERAVRVITHAHSDHLVGLRKSVSECALVVATPATHDLLSAMGYGVPEAKKASLPYGVPLEVSGELVRLLPSRHIVGSAQVLVETSDGLRLGYTGDFKLPGTPIMKGLDVLVIESTYGRPEWSRPFEEEVERVLVDLVKEGLAEGSVAVYGYYGKLQEAMEILRAGGVSAPFVMPWKVYAVTRAAVRHGLKVTGYYLEGSDEARRAVSQDHYVYFAHLSRFGEGKGRHALSVVLSGWEFREPARRVDARTWLVALSDHADFRQLVEYVSRAKPGVVVVDSYRNGAAGELASFVREYLGIEAYVAPGSGVPLA